MPFACSSHIPLPVFCVYILFSFSAAISILHTVKREGEFYSSFFFFFGGKKSLSTWGVRSELIFQVPFLLGQKYECLVIPVEHN